MISIYTIIRFIAVGTRVWFGCQVVLGVFASVSMFLLAGCDFISEPKESSMELIQTLSSVQDSAARCGKFKDSTADCIAVRDQLLKLNTDHLKYFLTDRGALIGTDFSKRVLVVLEPADESGSKWTCSVAPADVAPVACAGLK